MKYWRYCGQDEKGWAKRIRCSIAGSSATYVSALILMLEGYKVWASRSVDMRSNWYSLHPIQGRKSHEAAIDRAEHKVAGFMEKIHSNVKILYTGNNLYGIILGTLLSLESIVYLRFWRFFLATSFFANSNCESCMKCAAFCPHNAIEAEHFFQLFFYPHDNDPFVILGTLSGTRSKA